MTPMRPGTLAASALAVRPRTLPVSLAPVATATLVGNDLRDVDSERAAGKRALAPLFAFGCAA